MNYKQYRIQIKKTYDYYLLVCMLTKKLSPGFVSSFSAMLCFHFFTSLQVALASKCCHASPSLLLQTALHAQQLPVEHTEQPLLGLHTGLVPGPKATEQGRHHILVDLNPGGLQIIGSMQQCGHFKAYKIKIRTQFRLLLVTLTISILLKAIKSTHFSKAWYMF